MLKDRYGYELSTSSQQARDCYVEGIDLMLSAEGGVEDAMGRAIAADPNFALAHLAISRQHQFFGRIPEAKAASAKAAELVEHATPREQQQFAIYMSLFKQDIATSMELTKKHIQEFPRDAFALEPATGPFGSLGFSGQPDWETQQLELLESLADGFGDDWWFKTVHAFALQETGQWDRGRKMTEQALEQRPTNCHAAHTLAHALFESGDDEDAKKFMGGFLSTASRDGLLHCHNSWHHALLLMATGEQDKGFKYLQDNCMPGSTKGPSINVLTDCISFLWRAELAGAPRNPVLWQKLAEYYDTVFGGNPFVFVDAHIGLVYAALGDSEGLDACIAALEQAGSAGMLPAGTTAAELTRAYKAFAAEHWTKAIEIFEPLMDKVVRVGGSKAQRDVVSNTLIAAYVNDNRPDDALAFISNDDARQPARPILGLQEQGAAQ